MRRPLVLAAAGCALGFVGVFLIALHTSRGLRVDATLFERASGSDLVPVDSAGERTLATIDIGSLVVGAVLLGALALVRGHVERAIAAVALVGVSVASAELVKHGLPHVSGALVDGRPPTFPSGHSAVAASLGLALVLAAPPVARPAAALVGAAYAAAVGLSVIVLAWHYPSDVVGSYLLCGFWAACAGLALRSRSREFAVSLPGLVVALVLVAGALLIAAYVAGRHPVAVSEVRMRRSLVGLGALLGLFSLGMFGMFSFLLEERRS